MSKFPRTIEWENNKISITGEVAARELRTFASALYQLTERRGYKDIRLDFSDCSRVFEAFMLPAVALCEKRQSEGLDINLILPNDPSLSGLFRNANWAYFIDPRRYKESNYQGTQHVPAIRYRTPDEQDGAVDRAIDAILSSISGFDRGRLKALEWALSEITDNVLNHAETPHGGFLQVSAFPETSNVEFIVADAGIGIPESLGIFDHKRALEEAIKEGVTRDKSTNAGNGLFGSYKIAVESGGSFQLHSGSSSLLASAGDQLRMVNDRPRRFPGTSVLARIDCTKEGLLEEALRFNDQPHDPPFDYVERKYESIIEGEMSINLTEETSSFGSREAGKSVKKKITNLLQVNPNSVLNIDFQDVPIVSSSFADEVFGRLFAELGPIGFMKLIRLKNIDKTVQNLIDRAITQRVSSTNSSGLE